MKKVIVIGAGVGGLASAALLSAKGYKVEVYEKNKTIGGRSAKLKVGDFSFDTGPTFLLYKEILEEIYELIGEDINNYLKINALDPLYHLIFKDVTLKPSSDKSKTLQEIKKYFPKDDGGYEYFLNDQAKRFPSISKIMRMPFHKPWHYVHPNILKGIPHINPFRSLSSQLKKYFTHQNMQYATSFQSKYLGLAPYKTPALFAILSYLEHAKGIYHPVGGLNAINQAFKKIIEKNNGNIFTNLGVKKVHVERKNITHITLENNVDIKADGYFLNGDFAHSMLNLIDEDKRKPYTNKKLSKLDYSLSTFNIYLGLDKLYDLAHHTVVFSDDYENYVKKISENILPEDDLSIYVHNPSKIDDTLAPKGKSSLYILVPVPNLDSKTNWDEIKQSFKEKVIKTLEEKTSINNIKDHIEQELIITPQDWKDQYHVHKGAVFNLSHKISQMLYFRPHNQFNSINNLYLTGGGTHPGSGLPTIYLSALISTKLFNDSNKY